MLLRRAALAWQLEMSLAITHLISALTIGGAQKLLLDLSLETAAQGHKVRVISLRPGVMAQEFRRNGIPVDELSLGQMVSPRTLIRLVALLQRQHPDIVHTHLGRADNYGRVAALFARVPVVVSTAHNVEAWKERIVLRLIDGLTSTLADQIIACSSGVAEHLRELKLVRMDKVSIIRNGIRPRDWVEPPAACAVGKLRQELMASDHDFLIGVVGRLELQKGHEYLFRALAALKTTLPHFRLLVVGEGTLRASLEQLAAGLDLSANLIFTGVRRDMPLIYAAADLVVMPSLWEGLPITLLEAMACRRPVIATSVGGIPEVIEHEVNGLLVPPREWGPLAAAISRCCHDRELSHALAQAGFQTVMKDFSVETNARKVLALYRELVGHP